MFCPTLPGIIVSQIEPCVAFLDAIARWWPEELKYAVLAIAIASAYALGRRASRKNIEIVDQSRRDLRRAQTVANELENVSMLIRKQLAKHQTRVTKFKQRVSELSLCEHEAAWQALCQEAEDMLRPTLQLASQIASAYDTIRQQSGNLMTFTDVRIDPLTGLGNRRALDETLHSQIAMMQRYDADFTVAMFDIDHFKRINDTQGHLQGDRILEEVAKMLDDYVRETDTVARYGGEEFVVVMPSTSLDGAAIFADRIRARIEEKMHVTISGGVAAALKNDTSESLLSRADKSLYDAKKAGRNRVFKHDGKYSSLVVPETIEEETPLSTV